MINEKTISKCLKGNTRAQKMLYKTYAQKMFVICYRYVKNKEDAEEMVSDGFIKVFNNLEAFVFTDLKSLEAWIKRIVINECLMFLRKRKIILVEAGKAIKIKSENSPESELEAKEIYDLILSLPTGYRTVFNLFAIEGYSHKEISHMLNISESTSRSQLTKARAVLREKVSKSSL